MAPDFQTFGSADELTNAAVTFLANVVRTAQSERGMAVLGLSGGSTPGPVYTALAKEQGIDWSKAWLFLVDDRCIRKDDPKSNQFLLRSTILKDAPVPESQIIVPDMTLAPADAAGQYGQQLSALVRKHGIDVLVLGMGDDGHIASLFPPLSDEAFGTEAAVHTTTDRFDVRDRISVSLPMLMQAREALLLLKGDAKKKVYDEMMAAKEGPSRWPMKAILNRGAPTQTLWVA